LISVQASILYDGHRNRCWSIGGRRRAAYPLVVYLGVDLVLGWWAFRWSRSGYEMKP
jgi:hypothetical protein